MPSPKIQKLYVKNACFQRLEVLKTNRNKRYRASAIFVEGVRNINQAVANGWEFEAFIYSSEKKLSRWAEDILQNTPAEAHYLLPLTLMEELSGKSDTSELLAVVKMRNRDPLALHPAGTPLLALFDRPSNKGNLGAILRSCDALGVDGLAITGHGVDIYDPDTIAASMGSFFKVPFYFLPDNIAVEAWLACLRRQWPDLQTIATSAHGEMPVSSLELTGPALFLLGNETDGLCKKLYELSDRTVTIPMSDGSSASSFNVACAATVLFYEAARQRRG